jgi:hypothetical protein
MATGAGTEAFRASLDGGYRGDPLYPHQRENLVRFRRELVGGHGLLVADAPGLGKTLTAIACLCARRCDVGGRRCAFVVVPKTLVTHWLDALRECVALDAISVVEWGRVKDKAAFETKKNCVVVMTHRQLAGGSVADGRVGMVVFDESHVFRNESTDGFKAAEALGNRASAWMCLTGTPYVNRSKDIINQIKLCHGREEFYDMLGEPGFRQKELRRMMSQTSMIHHPKSVLNLPPLREHREEVDMTVGDRGRSLAVVKATLKDFARGEKQNALAAVGSIRLLAISRIMQASLWGDEGEEEEPEDEEEIGCDSHVRPSGAPALTRRPPARRGSSGRRELVASLMYMNSCTSADRCDPADKIRVPKLEAALRIIVEHAYPEDPKQPVRKVAVFCSYVAPLLALQKLVGRHLCQAKGKKPTTSRVALLGERAAPLICGSVSAKRRDEIVAKPTGRVHSDDGCTVLLSTFGTGGVGINLAPAVTVVVCLDVWWNMAVWRQAFDRVHRIGCERACDAYAIVQRRSFDTVCLSNYKYKEFNEDVWVKNHHTDAMTEHAAERLMNELLIEFSEAKDPDADDASAEDAEPAQAPPRAQAPSGKAPSAKAPPGKAPSGKAPPAKAP